jgi:excisionase family DNA binding protein
MKARFAKPALRRRTTTAGAVSPTKHIPPGSSRVDVSEVMTLQQLADYLSCHYTTVYRLLTRGELPGFRLGTGHSGWRFLRSDVDKWIAQRQVQPSMAKSAGRERDKHKPRRMEG